jgi:hypothetical protein
MTVATDRDKQDIALCRYQERNPHSCVTHIDGPEYDTGGREHYWLSDEERSGPLQWFCVTDCPKGQVFTVVVDGIKRDVKVRLREGHSGVDHLLWMTLRAIRKYLLQVGYFKTKGAAIAALEEVGNRAVKGGPSFTVEISGH